MYFRKQSGIGLLELMLAMAIIAILIVMSISYFQSSKNKTLISAGIEEVQDIIGVISGLSDPAASAGNSDPSNLSDKENGLTTSVMYSGSIPRQYVKGGKIITPWGSSTNFRIDYKAPTTTTDNTGDDPVTTTISGYAVIYSDNLPNYACTTLMNQFDQNEGLDAKCNSGTLTINVPLQSRQGIQSASGSTL